MPKILTEDYGWMSSADRRLLLEALSRDELQRSETALGLAVRDAVRAEWVSVDDRELLVLFALEFAGRAELLTDEERSRLKGPRQGLMDAMSDSKALADVVRRIGEDAREFEAGWQSSIDSGERHDRAGMRPMRSGRTAGRAAWRFTAVAALALFVAALLFIVQRDASRVTHEVAEGEIQRVNLADGSSIRIVGPATFSYLGREGSERPNRVWLEGGAYFDVVAGPDPFVVETRDARVAVLGTNFGVRVGGDETRVILASGKLAVSRRDRPSEGVELRPGESCVVRHGEAPSAAVPVDLVDAFAWADLFVFRGSQVAEIADVLSRHYGVDVGFESSLGTQKISGTFDRSSGAGDILEVVALSLGAQVEYENGRYRLIGHSD